LYSSGTGFLKSNECGPYNTLVAEKVEFFNNNVAKVDMGHRHTAVITGDGKLYTFGENGYG